MTGPSSSFNTWRERMAAADDDAGTVREALAAVADEITEARGREGSAARRWASAGIEVRVVAMRTRGYCEINDRATPLVHVSAADNAAAQQFTIAHEVGHLLLASRPRCLAGISHREEETICEEFAQRVIVPPAQLAQELAGERVPSPETVLTLCGTFQANPSTILRALGAQLRFDHTVYLLARLRTHYLRPAVMGFRIDAATGPQTLFWPFDTRIEKVGLVNLATKGAAAKHGHFIDGEDERIAVRLAKVDAVTGNNAAVGPASWRAARQGKEEPYLLAQVDCSWLRAARLTTRTHDRMADKPKASPARVAEA